MLKLVELNLILTALLADAYGYFQSVFLRYLNVKTQVMQKYCIHVKYKQLKIALNYRA